MAEAFLSLSRQDQLEALGVAATASGRPVHLLEKDVRVVWTLAALFESPFADHLVFKGGTSLSKAYKAIRRFSEDVDVTCDYGAAVSGSLLLVPEGAARAGLETDYTRMLEDGLLLDDAEPFEPLMARCRAIQERANAVTTA